MPTPNDLATRYRLTAHDTAGRTTTIHHGLTKPQAERMLLDCVDNYEQTSEIGILTADGKAYIVLDHVTTLAVEADEG